MTDEQINTIAREYAEQTDGSPVDIAYRKIVVEDAFRFLLRRYCIVEKSKVEREYQKSKDIIQMMDVLYGEDNLPIGDESISKQREKIDLLESLFPGIAKEVEE